MKLICFFSTKSNYIIPIVLFLSSFLIYSYNLEGQPWHGDEIVYLAQAGEYVHLIKNGNFDDSCLRSIDNCNYLFHIPAYGLTYSPLRNILIGFPMDVKSEDIGKFYNWSCYWQCYIHDMGPTVNEMTTARLFSPLFGALTVTISFLIGKILFNRNVGIIASLLFLFYDIWLWHSRTIMTEVHYIFFSMLSLLLLLYAFNTGQMKIKYFIASAMAFGLALTSKMLSIEFAVLFLGIILFSGLFKKQSDSTIKKRNIPKICLLIFLFFAITTFSLFLTEPGFYENPLKQISVMKKDMDNYNRDVWYIGYPTIHGIQINTLITVFHYVLFPSFIEKQISELHLSSNLEEIVPQTYSSIPLTIFFFVGIGYLIYRIKKFKCFVPETLVLIWFISTLVLSLAIAKDFSLERYLLPLGISIIFIASYGFWNFIKDIPYNKIKITFVIYAIFTHSITTLLSWQKIYFSPGTTWTNPLGYGTLQESLDNPLGFVVNATFVGFILFMFIIRFRRKTGHIVTVKEEEVKK
ncbi:phospholipid carrier-dependent glycosyltransferase [Candidatus Pacearchaeota archaeon]|nr:phospholipid carrier-dependent glycosyltransferase [Candidatus Pacearchaeota archaeon]